MDSFDLFLKNTKSAAERDQEEIRKKTWNDFLLIYVVLDGEKTVESDGILECTDTHTPHGYPFSKIYMHKIFIVLQLYTLADSYA